MLKILTFGFKDETGINSLINYEAIEKKNDIFGHLKMSVLDLFFRGI